MHRIRLISALAALTLLATGCADDPPPEPAPVVVAFDDGWGQLFVMNIDGSGLRQVTPTVSEDSRDPNYGYGAALSPDGEQLAYARGGFIEILDLESGESKSVIEGGYEPAFSPDGSKIAFTANGSINIMNVDGSDAHILAQEESAFGATFSPDSSRVVYVTGGYLNEVPVDGGESTVLLRDQFWNSDPAFSPDGSTLVFSSNRGGNNGSEIYAMPSAGGDITPLTDTYSVHPKFTPDGSRILYDRAVTQTGELVTDVATGSRPEIASMNPDGSDQKRLTPRSLNGQMPTVGGGR
jgi:TolB protein